MRKTLSGGVIFALLVTLVLSPAVFAEDQPTIVIEKMRHDFGQVFEQDMYRHAFKVRNEGNANLVIEKVKPG